MQLFGENRTTKTQPKSIKTYRNQSTSTKTNHQNLKIVKPTKKHHENMHTQKTSKSSEAFHAARQSF